MNLSEKRRQNIYWTVGGNYQRRYHGEGNGFAVAERAMIDRAFPKNRLSNFVSTNAEKVSNGKDMRTVATVLALQYTREALYRERPGVASRAFDEYKKRFKKLEFQNKRDISEEIYMQYAAYRIGKPMSAGTFLEPLMRKLIKGEEIKSESEFYRYLQKLWREHFHVNPTLTFEVEEKMSEPEETQEPPKEPPKKKRRCIVEGGQACVEDSETEIIESAEFSGVIRDTSKVVESDASISRTRNDSETRTLSRVRKHFGVESESPGKIRRLESKIATGIHKGMRLHVTKGNFKGDMGSRFFEDQVLAQRKETEEIYEKDSHIYERSIFELREIIRKNLLDDSSEAAVRAANGAIDTSLLWRHVVLNDDRIFKKTHFEEETSFAVDILLDMSGSQQDRQESVAIQGYLIAEALTALRIPTRVMGFCNLFNYQIIRVFRDYRDERKQNREIFNYKASGSNRDGFALRYVFETMEEMEADTHVLIVLSDGMPNDLLSVGFDSGHSDVADYEGEEAVYDAAAEVLQGKLKQKAVLGVFTGDDEELDQERLIFGTDFVRIKDLNRFSVVVGKYLKSVVDRLQ
ncbi:MAG: hypothetical protein SPI65_06850 [Peptoniphilus sp.]|nr:hypothetical protein [Peptoniphilus sp.]MDD7363008.1 hypothetical protein [Bacillota bacterium]MDY6045273.1 hypothetical protein [Peptoniphilus sp.]